MNLFSSPEFYPLEIDFRGRMVRFLRMTSATYRDSVFLDGRARHIGGGIDLNLDDLLLASESAFPVSKPVHYILNTAFCGSTLLARYFELLPSCFVLKEPCILAQLASEKWFSETLWKQCFNLCTRLLTRTYTPGQMVVIKPLESCNVLATKLLDSNCRSTITFLGSPLRHFLLAVLKSGDRRHWVWKRAQSARNDATGCDSLSNIDCRILSAPESGAYVWLVDRFLCNQLLTAANRDRIFPLNVEALIEAPKDALESISRMHGLLLTPEQVDWMVSHPSMQKHSKHASRPYDRSSRDVEMKELERCWGAEADQGVKWAESHLGGTVDVGLWP